MKTKVVNIRKDKFDVKICRTSKNEIPDYPAVGFAGNPFFLKNVNNDEERVKVIEQYRKYFEERIKNDKNFKEGIESLRGKRLACFCSPKPCHGDVIVEYLEGDNYDN